MKIRAQYIIAIASLVLMGNQAYAMHPQKEFEKPSWITSKVELKYRDAAEIARLFDGSELVNVMKTWEGNAVILYGTENSVKRISGAIKLADENAGQYAAQSNSQQPVARPTTYQFSGGRFGDYLMSYFK